MQKTVEPAAVAPIDPTRHVADLVTAQPALAAVFEELGVEYCCGGKIPLAEACEAQGLPLERVVSMLEAAGAPETAERDWSTASISELVTNIVDVHHAYLHESLPRLGKLAHKVARAHGDRDPRLVEARDAVDALIEELAEHLVVEEEGVFPVCLRVGAGEVVDASEVGQLLRALEDDHQRVADRLTKLHVLLDDLVPPAGACPTYRAYLDTLQRVERDIHRHVHKENHILFDAVRRVAAAPA